MKEEKADGVIGGNEYVPARTAGLQQLPPGDAGTGPFRISEKSQHGRTPGHSALLQFESAGAQ